MRRLGVMISVLLVIPAATAAQETRRGYAGVVFGVSTLSADGRSETMPPEAVISLYKPENGWAVNVLAGYHLWRFFSLQANYVWNRNDLTLVSSFVTPDGGGFYEQRRGSSQHVVVADTLVYFRKLDSRVRPYLGTGVAIVRFDSGTVGQSISSGLTAPQGSITAIKIALRSHVGIDLALSKRFSFRYSFSETISGNPVSPHLTPPGGRGLANFQNLFGLLARW